MQKVGICSCARSGEDALDKAPFDTVKDQRRSIVAAVQSILPLTHVESEVLYPQPTDRPIEGFPVGTMVSDALGGIRVPLSVRISAKESTGSGSIA